MRLDIEIVAFDRMKNEEWFQFITEYRDMAAVLMAENADYIRFLELHAQLDAVLEQIRKSSYTGLITEADAKRDTAFRSFRDMVKAMQTHVEPEKQKMAGRVMLVLDAYGNIAQKGLNDKTASISNFYQELSDNYIHDVGKLGLADWVVRLDNANKEFQEMVMKRNDEQSEKLKLSIAELRRQVGELYGVMTGYIEANVRLAKDDAWMALFNKLNANIIRYRNTLAQRKGIARAKKEKQAEPAGKDTGQTKE